MEIHEKLKQYLSSLAEDQLRTIVMLPLLRAMGLKDVVDYHGGGAEKGKDVIGWYADPTGQRRYVAVVLKKGDLHPRKPPSGSGSSSCASKPSPLRTRQLSSLSTVTRVRRFTTCRLAAATSEASCTLPRGTSCAIPMAGSPARGMGDVRSSLRRRTASAWSGEIHGAGHSLSRRRSLA
jgi:hypothetical protein